MDNDLGAAGEAVASPTRRVISDLQREYRLTPAMASRKLQVVSFVQQYIARWGSWPSYGEIAGAMGIHRDTARDAVRRAVRDKLLDREPGSRKPRVDPPRLTATEAVGILDQLRAAGFIIQGPTPSPDTPTFCPLPLSPPFRHLPDIE